MYEYDNELNPLKCLAEKEDGHSYLLSSKYAEAQLSRLKSHINFPKDDLKFVKNGPCASYKSGVLMHDNVFTLECSDWPPVAAEWETRARRFEWPDEKLRNAVVNTKCSLVPIGNPASKYNVRKFEWRISFLLGERQLMWSLNQSQYFCFILLKKLKKHFIDPGHKDIISSFILKTTLFWELEETKLDTWNEKTLIEKVQSCLNRLRRYVEKKIIPHYFARANNLFTGKYFKDKSQKELLELIDSLSQNLLVYLCMDALIIISPFVDCKDTHFQYKWREDKVISRSYFYGTIENALHLCTLSDLKRFEHGLDEQKGQYILDVHKKKAKELLSLKIATTRYRTYDNEPEKEKVKEMLNEIEKRYKEAKDVDAICGRLHLATFYLKQQRFTDVEDVISSIFKKETLLYDGACSVNRVIQFNDKKQIHEEKELDTANDISFFHSDMCVPDVVQAELRICKEEIIRIHPLVYMYLLEFLVSMESEVKQKKALENLSNEVQKSQGGHDTNIAVQICRYCHFVFGQRKFLRCFEIRRSVRNTRLFYVCVFCLSSSDAQKAFNEYSINPVISNVIHTSVKNS